MSMIGCFYSCSDSDLKALLEKPNRIMTLLGAPPPIPNPPTVSFFGKLFGRKAPPPAPPEAPDPWKPSQEPESMDVDKAWQGIHYLLTGTDGEGEGPRAFMLLGGREIPEDLGYGPARGFNSAQVKEIAAVLQPLNLEELYKNTDPAALAALDIYPEIWTTVSKEESIGYLIDNLNSLREFLTRSAAQNRALIVYLG